MLGLLGDVTFTVIRPRSSKASVDDEHALARQPVAVHQRLGLGASEQVPFLDGHEPLTRRHDDAH